MSNQTKLGDTRIRVKRQPFLTSKGMKLWHQVVAYDGTLLGYPQPRAILARNWLTDHERRLALYPGDAQ